MAPPHIIQINNSVLRNDPFLVSTYIYAYIRLLCCKCTRTHVERTQYSTDVQNPIENPTQGETPKLQWDQMEKVDVAEQEPVPSQAILPTHTRTHEHGYLGGKEKKRLLFVGCKSAKV